MVKAVKGIIKDVREAKREKQQSKARKAIDDNDLDELRRLILRKLRRN